ncbi:MAG TPA: hypothetical protein VF290_07850 [Pyrinomonadaceae bacterium]
MSTRLSSPQSWITSLVIGVLIASVAFVNAENCPPCFKDQNFPISSGQEDGRAVLDVKIDSSWNVDNSGNQQGGTNTNIWNALAGCEGCLPPDGAAGMWNNAQGTGGTGIFFKFKRNQSSNSPAVIIKRGNPPSGGCASILLAPNGGPYVITLPLSTASMDSWAVVERIAHELGHAIGLGNITDFNCGLSSIMSPANSNCSGQVGRTVTQKDVDQSRKAHGINSADCETSSPGAGTETSPESPCFLSCPFVEGTRYIPNPDCTGCIEDPNYTPVLIDVSGDGLSLTNYAGGVGFDLNGDGTAEQLSWTRSGADDAWLVLDRNGNGLIDNGSELFGNFTPQPVPPAGGERNGFLALAEYDKPLLGGDGNGVITDLDAIFTSLRLWQDINHNGVSEASELFSLQTAGLKTLELSYKTSKYVDPNGNLFRYRAKVKDTNGAQAGRWAWDVFLVSGR